MKKAIVFVGMACLATSALAFGGGGGGQSAEKYNRHNPGVDNFGVHIHPDNPPLDIRFYDIKDDENAKPCQDGANVYCCKEGYIVDVATSKCVACPSGSVASLDENFKCTVCKETEHPNTDKTACVVPADGITNQEECEKSGYKWCSGNGSCVEKEESCSCSDEGNGCQICDEATGSLVVDANKNNEPCGEDGLVCVNGECVGQLYCAYTNSNGECGSWQVCSGTSTKDWILNSINAGGACAYAGQELYCSATNDNKVCRSWGVCAEGKSTKDMIRDLRKAKGACAGEGEDVYCYSTNEEGTCTDWRTCAEGKSTSATGSNATGLCAGEGKEVFCYSTNDKGECQYWSTCTEGKSTKKDILGIPDAWGVCAYEGDEVYCVYTNDAGECNTWSTCAEGKSTGKEIRGVSNARGGCAREGEELYCYETNDEGACRDWDTCTEGKSISASGPNAEGTCNW